MLTDLAVEIDVEQTRDQFGDNPGYCVENTRLVATTRHPNLGEDDMFSDPSERFGRLSRVVDILDGLDVVPGRPEDWHDFHAGQVTPVTVLTLDHGPHGPQTEDFCD